eukprot:scpid55322/ scgid28133/ tRNA-specific adenosine deaminase-like protein 3; tRNA-specific adenosine-34 deaminase subunit adat3
MSRSAFEAVLAHKFYNDVETDRFWAACIADAKSASKVLKSLSDSFPLPKCLRHVKRIRRVEVDEHRSSLHVLLCSAEELDSLQVPDCQRLLESRNISTTLFSEYLPVDVPMSAPLTLQQWTKVNQCWPCAWHEDKKMTLIREGKLFSPADLDYVHSGMQVAIQVAKHARASGQSPIGAVLVDPAQQKVLGVGTDESLPTPMPFSSQRSAEMLDPVSQAAHSLKHAVMMCIDDLARQQGGGAWAKTPHSDNLQAFRGPLPSASRVDRKETGVRAPYLCTGYDLFVTREPCVMCSMALVHSRIGRVFYGAMSRTDGALGSQFLLHCEPGLNHHFDVYRQVCEDECMQLWPHR